MRSNKALWPRHSSRHGARFLFAALATLCLTGCTRNLELIQDPPRHVAVTTTGSWASMIFVARTDRGVIVIDLGWMGAERALDDALGQLDATRADVKHVFLTHAHRDHIAAWRLVRQARFHMGAPEVPYFADTASYTGVIPQLGDAMSDSDRPKAGDLVIAPFATDTTFHFGGDSLRAFTAYGHTAGSTVYLFRGILFGGDAVNWRVVGGFAGARPEMSDDPARSRASMAALWSRLDPMAVRVICSAHAKCAPNDIRLRSEIQR